MKPPRIRPPRILCTPCNSARLYSTPSTLPPAPPSSGAANLSNRRLLAVQGQDAAHFLHGITTATVRTGQTTGFYSAFLNAQGRVLNDVFLYPAMHNEAYRAGLSQKLARDADAGGEAYLIEVDGEQADLLYKHLRKYKLRAKVDVRFVEQTEWDVWSLWDEKEPWTPHPPASSTGPTTASVFQEAKDDGSTSIGCVDARGPGMGRRLLLPSSTPIGSFPETELSAYTIRRMLRGIPEGQSEIPYAAALPQEYNIDFMGGIDFKKGCYVGQELTIRTHHTGVVRKRVLPVMLYESGDFQKLGLKKPENLEYSQEWRAGEIASGTNIMPAGDKVGRSAGKWVTGVGNVGLALCRIEMMTDMVLTAEGGSRWKEEDEFKIDVIGSKEQVVSEGEVRIKAFVPDWHRSKTKVRKPQIRV